MPDQVLLAWPDFLLDGEWVSVTDLYAVGSGGEQFTNSGGETLFGAIRHSKIDWDGTCHGPSCDLSKWVIQDLGRCFVELRDRKVGSSPSGLLGIWRRQPHSENHRRLRSPQRLHRVDRHRYRADAAQLRAWMASEPVRTMRLTTPASATWPRRVDARTQTTSLSAGACGSVSPIAHRAPVTGARAATILRYLPRGVDPPSHPRGRPPPRYCRTTGLAQLRLVSRAHLGGVAVSAAPARA